VAGDEDPEDLVEREPLLAGGFDLDPRGADSLDHIRQSAAGVVDDHTQMTRAVLAHLPHAFGPHQILSVEDRRRLDLEEVAVRGRSAEVVRGREGDDRAADDQGDLVALLRFGECAGS
jgi:hypothetical protein